MVIDLRKKRDEVFKAPPLMCGCVCNDCGWRGYRVVRFYLDLDTGRLDAAALTKEVRGKVAQQKCGKCQGSVVFTHTNCYPARD